MTKDDQGVWSVTLGPLDPELYGYGFTIDGFRTADPMNREVKPMRSPTTSILEIPGKPPLLHEFQDVPHERCGRTVTIPNHWSGCATCALFRYQVNSEEIEIKRRGECQ